MKLTYMLFLKTSLPFTLSTVAASLMGAVDTAVVGHLGDYSCINAVALGATIFSTTYWLFGFLKISTSAFAAQAIGKNDMRELNCSFLRGALAAFFIGISLTIFQEPIWRLALKLFSPDSTTLTMLEKYYRVLIFTMPLALVFQTAQGWFAGSLHVHLAVFIALSSNVLNLVLDVLFVVYFHLGVEGVAAATCIANVFGCFSALFFYLKFKPSSTPRIRLMEIISGPAFRNMAKCGSHLTVRMLCMIVMVNSFMSQSSAYGGLLLAANAILFQIQFIMGDILTGLSQAGAIYSGIAFGGRNKPMLKDTLRISFVWAMCFGLGQSLFYFVCRHAILSCFTDLDNVISMATRYDLFIALFPTISTLGIVYYGIFNGALCTKPICISMLMTETCYLASYFLLVPPLGNDGLWLSFLIFYIARSGFLLLFVPQLCATIA